MYEKIKVQKIKKIATTVIEKEQKHRNNTVSLCTG